MSPLLSLYLARSDTFNRAISTGITKGIRKKSLAPDSRESTSSAMVVFLLT